MRSLTVTSEILCVLTFFGGIVALLYVRTDVGALCAVLVTQCGWIIKLLARIAANTARP